jgi:hypothetical protein
LEEKKEYVEKEGKIGESDSDEDVDSDGGS